MELPPKPKRIHSLEFVRILTPYVLSCHMVRGTSVLDVGCGLGHGSWLLATNGAERVVAVDLNEAKARQAFGYCASLQKCNVFIMDAQRLGLQDASFNVVTCFEVIEHVPKPDALLSELRRILKVDGVLVLTTPNRAVRLLPLQRPWNPEHLREYTLKALQRSLQKYFSSFAVLGIYGEPEPYRFYRRLWQQNALRVYLGWGLQIMRVLTPASVKRWIRNQLGRSNSTSPSGSDADLLINIAVPVPDPETWPFWVRDVKEDCLNFLVVCGFNDQIVQRAVGEIIRLRR